MTPAITILNILKDAKGHRPLEEVVREHADERCRPRLNDEQFQVALRALEDNGFARHVDDPLSGRCWFITEQGEVRLDR